MFRDNLETNLIKKTSSSKTEQRDRYLLKLINNVT
jgi:hypothetical protein